MNSDKNNTTDFESKLNVQDAVQRQETSVINIPHIIVFHQNKPAVDLGSALLFLDGCAHSKL